MYNITGMLRNMAPGFVQQQNLVAAGIVQQQTLLDPFML